MAVTPLTGEEASTGMPFVAVPTALVTITNLPGIPFALKPSQVTGTVSIMTIGPMVGQFGVPTPAVLSLTSQPTAVSNGYY
jgi:hypothetical protein